ncbi:hypothetical protein HMPREF9318_01958 [Streptococcus urinalis FB127-CNA-2]|uniref:PF06570 family protein n=1 Tax=Streptococcus urinalis 2285-97 TaxID=764291 RepID=G5KCZ8_9STRE|nr:DUF1129 family protein [Streptococcus urinalis]EHJ55699.1 hypothetical protein STRUR_1820 [Streptococcus urinalis 2285-97]EKS17081.1 hypothetical protein HMPREF9318_01958 [Streptococcus urinalis FB127-CNA-2]VEF32669.1 membrane protein [Streptococcus urinalis]
MNIQELTRKNQDFVNIATHYLIQDGKTDQEIKSILEAVLPDIIENQKKGIPARSFLGAPTTWASQFTAKTIEANKQEQPKNDNPWLMWLDTSLLFTGFVALLNGLMSLFGNNGSQTGLLSLLALGFGGGASMYLTYYFVYRHMGKPKDQRPRWYKIIGYLVLAMAAWILIFSASALLPAVLNPKLPAIALIIIGGIAFALRYYLQKKYNILNAMAPQQVQK